jgi:ABC-type antimicrobial peptide transport system permease subunit
MGFDTDSILTFSTPWYIKDNRGNILHNELNQMPEIKMISRNTSAPARNTTTTSTLTLLDNETERPLNVHQRSGDTSYFRLFKIPIISGRVLQASDSAMEIMVNEAYCEEMGYEPIDMVGQQLKGSGKKNQTIVGVMKDFHFRSMHHKIEPLFYRYSKEASGFSVKLNSSDNLTETVEKIEKVWNKIYPEVEFSSTFLDERIKNFYASEKRISKLTNTATGLTIFISCLGLLGLTAFTSTQRTKEIGIRKVLGASVSNIVKLLSGEFITTVAIAMLVATPIAWYGGNYWLNKYAFKIEIGWMLFVIAGGLSILISFITVAFQTIGAALSNPVESLRYE